MKAKRYTRRLGNPDPFVNQQLALKGRNIIAGGEAPGTNNHMIKP